MKLSSSGIAPRGGLRVAAVLVMCCSILAHISAMDEAQERQRRGENQNTNRVSADGAETGEEQSLMHRERRSVNNNATPSLSDIEKRLQEVEERYAMLDLPIVFQLQNNRLFRINLMKNNVTF